MDDQPSPPNTQLINDTQRLRRNPSGLDDKDLSDVVAILHPYTNVAIKAVAEVARTSPQHILQNELLSDGDLDDDDHDDEEVLDIALRLSSKLKDPCAGFRFGRNPSSCDVVLGHSGPMPMVSNVHFRIYLTPDEVLMLQDTSTNGTVVDGVILGRLWDNPAAKAAHAAGAGNDKPRETRVDPNTARRRDGRDVTSRMLTQGSIINLISSSKLSHEEIKFIVRIPSRHGHEDAYERRLGQFLELVERETQERALVAPRLHINGNAADLVRMVAGHRHDPWSPVVRRGGPVMQPRRPGPTTRSRLAKAWSGGPKYNVIGTIGKGAFATVYKVATKDDGKVFAAKELSRRQFRKNNTDDRKFDSEMDIMKQLRHPNIVQYIEHYVEPDAMYIIMEYVPNGDLSSLIYEQGALPEPSVRLMARQLLEALDYLHKCRITHRDIKPDNILLLQTAPIQVKLSDFGLSKMVNEQTILKTFCGTLLYCAPEVFSRYPEYLRPKSSKRRREAIHSQPRSYNHACDIWSFAAVLFMSLSAKPPYSVETGDRDLMLEKIMTTELDVGPLQARSVSEDGVAFVQRLLNLEPQLRPTETQCLSHPWLQSIKDGDAAFGDVGLGIGSQLGVPGTEHADGPSIDADETRSLLVSRLSIQEIGDDSLGGDNEGSGEVDLDERMYLNVRSPKRTRTMPPPGFSGDVGPPSSPAANDSLVNGGGSRTRKTSMRPLHKPNRLFGEVGHSAIGSSGVIPPDHLNLAVSIRQEDESYLSSEASAFERVIELGESHQTRQNSFTEQHASLPGLAAELEANLSSHPVAAASLLGAESLVGHLNMTSISTPPSLRSREVAPSTTASRIQPGSSASSMTVPREDNHAGNVDTSGDNDDDDDDDDEQSTQETQRPTATGKAVRRTGAPVPNSLHRNPRDKSTHMTEYIARMRANDRSPDHMNTDPVAASMPDLGLPRRQAEHLLDGRPLTQPDVVMTLPIHPASTRASQTGKAVERSATVEPDHKSDGQPSSGRDAGDAGDDVGGSLKPMSPATGATGGEGFARPLPMLGKLLPTAKSELQLPIRLNQRMTTWGRGGMNTVVYPHGHEARVPKYAFEILFWKPGIQDLMQRGVDWTQVSDVRAVIQSKSTSKPIYVNGVPLLRGGNGGGGGGDGGDPNPNPNDMNKHPTKVSCSYGRLYTGDVITIWKDVGTNKEISFVCHFYHGASTAPRPKGMKPFEVEHADLK